jgi:hypothetical protein
MNLNALTVDQGAVDVEENQFQGPWPFGDARPVPMRQGTCRQDRLRSDGPSPTAATGIRSSGRRRGSNPCLRRVVRPVRVASAGLQEADQDEEADHCQEFGTGLEPGRHGVPQRPESQEREHEGNECTPDDHRSCPILLQAPYHSLDERKMTEPPSRPGRWLRRSAPRPQPRVRARIM